ncbi:Protein of unknown function [Sphingobacterium wenxiniae]|uniref:DUF4199 domain-containing protein n=2 Tax=Sphingobacterium wenxiniae TaxID=683125 RepID=A0A1I6VTM9_9SPHI|nr:Protein of unknown function [Sphingobacterium wenxiniae]
MTNTFPEAEVRKESIKNGIYIGVIVLILNIVSVYMLVNVANFQMASIVSSGLFFVILIALAVYFSSLLRKVAGGFWSFSQALKHIFLMLAISVLISQFGSAVFNAINPEPQQIVFDKTINFTIETLESVGADDEMIDKQVAELEKTREELRSFSLGQTLKGVGITLIMYFVFSLILAAIFKRERPAFMSAVDNTDNSAHPWQDNN